MGWRRAIAIIAIMAITRACMPEKSIIPGHQIELVPCTTQTCSWFKPGQD